jgi:hypothetical protein
VIGSGARLATAFRRYADLVLRQIEALDQVDLSIYTGLAVQREELAAEIDRVQAARQPGDGVEAAEVVELEQELDRCAAADRMLRERLRELRATTRGAVNASDRGRTAARRYHPDGARGARVDMTL